MIIGIEVGGTFTDLVMAQSDGTLAVHKVPSTPSEPSIAAVQGLVELLALNKCEASAVSELLHGSTIAANALIQRRGARTVLLTTAGFRDVLFVQRQDKSTVYDMFYQKPVPLIGRNDVYEVAERLGPDGETIVALSEDALVEVVDRMVAERNPESIAICFLHGYANPKHEQLARAVIARGHPDIRVSLSSEVSPEHREYERTSTTVIDAYIGPAVERYLGLFGERAAEIGVPSMPLIMQSNGGVVPLATAKRRAANMFVSGPAAAVTAAAQTAREEDILDVISVDIGGTSCDVCLIRGAMPQTTMKGTSELNVDGLPLNVMMTDIVTIGAGGGSVASVDVGGKLRVGPDSAGADPGPACYAKGGTAFTLTDATVLLGVLDATVPLPGDIRLQPQLAEAAAMPLAEQFGLTALELADRVYKIAVANMAQAVRRVSVQRGYDPRDFALLPCGGAGPPIAAALANEVGMRTILVPLHPGIFSALGLAVADIRIDYVQAQSAVELASLDSNELEGRVRELGERADKEFSGLGYAVDQLVREFAVDARYQGQGYELRVPFSETELTEGPEIVMRRFHELHQQQYGHSFADSRVEAISFRLTARVLRGSIASVANPAGTPGAVSYRQVDLPGARANYTIYQRSDLPSGFTATGPAIIVERTTSLPVMPGWRFQVTKRGAVVVKRIDE
jgi:N-methylhydantoinase A